MVRISPVVPETATPDEAAALQKIREAWGGVPNLWAVIARSPALTEAVLAFGCALEKGVFSGAISEQLAIAVAHENRCPYCLAGHTAAGLARGLDAEAVADARAARSADPKTEAALRFVQAVVRERGHVSDADLAAARAAGWDDGAIVELVGHATATILTNYLHHLSQVPVDFPSVPFAEAVDASVAA